MRGSSGSGGPARSGAGRAAPGKGSRQVDVGNSRGASQPAVASGGAAQPDLQELVDEIIQLGHMPTQSKHASIEETRLARRLIRARKAGSLTREQVAALDKLLQASKTRSGQRNAEKLVDEIIQLGHMPTQSRRPAHVREKRLAERLTRARKAGWLTREQQAALDNIAQASVIETPSLMERLMDEISQLGHCLLYTSDAADE